LIPAVRSKGKNILDRSEAKKNYKQAKRPMGVYRIRNTRNGKSYVGFSMDLPARLSRHKAELKFGSHRNTELLGEWKLLGESCFEFEVLDELEYEENSESNPTEELDILTEIWIRKLEKEGSSVVRL
jgi:hypothetical protein